MPIVYPPEDGFDIRASYPGDFSDELARMYPDKLSIDNPLPANPSNSYHYDTFTLEFYIYPRSLGSGNDVLTCIRPNGDVSDDGFVVRLRDTSGSNVLAYVYGVSVTGGDLTLEQWHHIELSFDRQNSLLTLWVGGTQVDQVAASNLDLENRRIVSTRSGQAADASLANLRIWDTARTSSEVAEDMTTDYPEDTPGLLAAYSLAGGRAVEESHSTSRGVAVMTSNTIVDSVERWAAPAVVITELAEIYDLKYMPGAFEKTEPIYHGQISGTVTVKGDPAAQRVMAFNRTTGKKVAETTSAEGGSYTLTGLDPSAAHYVVALDKNLEYNGVIADNITPEVPA